MGDISRIAHYITLLLTMQTFCFLHATLCEPIQYLELGRPGTLQCMFGDDFFGVFWYNSTDYRNDIPILLFKDSVKSGIGYNSGEYDVHENGSLLINNVSLHHEQHFTVAYFYSQKDTATYYAIDVIVVVYPVPSHPIVKGCKSHRECLLKVDRVGNLTCTLHGVRPEVALEWRVLNENDAALISFSGQLLTRKSNGITFDISLTTTYHIHQVPQSRLKIECTVPRKKMSPLTLSTKISVEMTAELSPVVNTNGAKSSEKYKFWWFLLFLVPVIIILISIVWCKVHNKGRTNSDCLDPLHQRNTTEETAPMFEISRTRDLQENTITLKNELRKKYQDLYDAVQPIPYIKDRLYCVDRVFVEGGISFLVSKDVPSTSHIWKNLESYRGIFNDSQVLSTRRILEGEPGYGKSTVTLQFAYDWCNRIPESPLKNVDVLILLRLRQLGGVDSIFRAIKQFILPYDTRLNEEMIEKVIRDSKKVVFILDGYDEYPDQQRGSASDIIKIIENNMFQEMDVVLTTRSSFLPTYYPPLTKRIRLTGFDDKARIHYIQKAVLGENNDGVETLQKHLQENPILNDLCQVPLLFVIFAHMTHESERFRKLNSVTRFFCCMIKCFHSHMKNKMRDENVRKCELYENEHNELDKLAFKALSGHNQQIVWNKRDLCQLIGFDFYHQYMRTGILVEEEVVDIIDDPVTPITDHEQYKTEVRFYHKLFCEWYAAHYLTKYLQANPKVALKDFLQYLDITDLQYVYRFACGLNFECAKKIINYLMNIEGGPQLAILCLMENTERMDDMKEIIEKLCLQGLLISSTDSLLLQRSSIQLLEEASKLQIPVREVNMHNCFKSVDFARNAIQTESGLFLCSTIPIKVLNISLYHGVLPREDVEAILEYSPMCRNLKELWLTGFNPPFSFTVGSTLSSISSCNFDIKWRLLRTTPTYVLNLLTGQWENEQDGEKLTEQEYNKMVQTKETDGKTQTKEGHKKAAERGRNRMRMQEMS